MHNIPSVRFWSIFDGKVNGSDPPESVPGIKLALKFNLVYKDGEAHGACDSHSVSNGNKLLTYVFIVSTHWGPRS